MNEFNIALYKGASYKIITLNDYTNMSEDERANIKINFNQISLSLCIDGEEILSHLISFGSAAIVLAQFGHVIKCLSKGGIALMRSGVMDVSEGHYLFFTSASDSESVLISLISIAELPIGEYFPHGQYGGDLYDYVIQNYKALIEQSRKRSYPVEIEFNRNDLIENLKLNKELGMVNTL